MASFFDFFKDFAGAQSNLSQNEAQARASRAAARELRAKKQEAQAQQDLRRAKSWLVHLNTTSGSKEDFDRAYLEEAKARSRIDTAKYNQSKARDDYNKSSNQGGFLDAAANATKGTSAGEGIALAARAVSGDPIAILQMAGKIITNQVEGLKNTAKSAGKALTSQDATGAVSNIGQALEDYGGSRNPLKALGIDIPITPEEVIGKFVKSMMAPIEGLKKMGDLLHANNMRFAEFSGGMARVEANQMRRDIYFSKARGDARAESAEELAQARQNFRERLSPFDDAWANFSNNIGAGLLNFGTNEVIPGMAKFGDLMLGAVGSFIPGLGHLMGNDPLQGILNKPKITQAEGIGQTMGETFAIMGDEDSIKKISEGYQRPGRFNNPTN